MPLSVGSSIHCNLVERADFVVGLLVVNGKDSLRLSLGWNYYLYFINP